MEMNPFKPYPQTIGTTIDLINIKKNKEKTLVVIKKIFKTNSLKRITLA